MDFLNLLISMKYNLQFFSYFFTSFVIDSFLNAFMFIDSILIVFLDFLEITAYFNLSQTSLSLIITSIKFLICISLLIFARGGIPRFRFDYLTKLG